MAEISSTGEYFVQIGVTALRDPSGRFLPSVPLFIKVDFAEVHQQTGLVGHEETLCSDIAGIFAGRFKRYISECGLNLKQSKTDNK